MLAKLVLLVNLAAFLVCAAALLGVIRLGAMTPGRKRAIIVLMVLTLGIVLMYIPRVL